MLVTLDTVRADALGSYGQTLETTPLLDRIAREGVVFEQVESAAPHTLASHASIFTGLFPYAHGVRGNQGYMLSPSQVTWAEILADAGYRTRAEIAAPVLRSATRIAQGFGVASESDAPLAEGTTDTAARPAEGGFVRRAENVSRRGVEFLRASRDAPFFLWLHYFDAHLPYAPRPELRSRIPDSAYLREVAAIDRALGDVFDTIEALGLRDHTLVVVTSDHGEGLGEHGEPTHSYFVYETTMRVPLILWGPPALPKGRRISAVVRTVDILPTVLDLLGQPAPEGLHGRSLRPLVDGSADDLGLVGYGESLELHRLFRTTPLRLLREGRWKYVHEVHPALYDLETDPAETTDLAAAHPEIVERLRARLRALLEAAPEASDDAVRETSASERAELEALGYLDAARPPRLDEVATLEETGPAPEHLVAEVERISRAKGHLKARHWQRAIDRLEPVVERHPESGTVHGLLAEAYAGLGRREAAIRHFERAIELEGNACSHLRIDYGRSLAGFGDTRRQLEVLEDGLATCPGLRTYLNEIAWTLATSSDASVRDGPRALAIARRLVGEQEGEPDANLLDTLAAAHAASGDAASAARAQRRAIEILERDGAPEKLIAAYRRTAARYEQAASR